jgi:hypothetical protein
MKDYYKKIDKSFFRYGITIPKEFHSSFLFDDPIELGSSREINIKFKKRDYKCKINYVNRKNSTPVYQIRWDGNSELLTSLKIEFIQTYIAIESQNFQAKSEDKYYITKLLGGNQEVVVIKPISKTEIKFDTFIKINTAYDELFKKLVERNVFGWISEIESKNIITKSTKWHRIDKLKDHEDIPYVVYYLVDDLNKEIYIGSAKRLGDRVKPNRKEIPGWNKFRYEIVHPNSHGLLRNLEYHSIMNFSKFFYNSGNSSSLKLSEYKLVNKDYKYYMK